LKLKIYFQGEASMIGKITQKMIIFLIGIYPVLVINSVCAQEKTFIKEYTYAASDLDSKVSSRTIALEQVKKLVLEELGTYLKSETEVKNFQLTSDQLTAFSAGIIKISVIDEKWDGKTYYIKAQIIADPAAVSQAIARVLADQTNSRLLEETSKKAETSLKEIERLKNELETMKVGGKRQQEYEKAVDILSAKQWFDKGYALVSTGNFREAIPAYLEVIKLEPDNVAAHIHLAWAYNGTGQFKEAIVESNRALTFDPENEYAFLERGWSYNGLGEFQKASTDLDKALNLNPNDQWVFYHRAWACNALGNYEQAKKDMDSALKIDPGQQLHYIMRGWAYNGLGKYQEALADLNTAVRLNPNNKYAYVHRGWALNGMGNYDQAENDFNLALNLDPGFADAYYNLAIFYYYRTGKEKALIFLAKAISLDAGLKQRAKVDTNFKSLSNDREFKMLVN
jgi:tetratricopeptide (TPR) repeat protein